MNEMPLLKRYTRDAEYESILNKNVMVPMRDDVRLATDIYLPALKGKPVEVPETTEDKKEEKPKEEKAKKEEK